MCTHIWPTPFNLTFSCKLGDEYRRSIPPKEQRERASNVIRTWLIFPREDMSVLSLAHEGLGDYKLKSYTLCTGNYIPSETYYTNLSMVCSFPDQVDSSRTRTMQEGGTGQFLTPGRLAMFSFLCSSPLGRSTLVFLNHFLVTSVSIFW
jgi:hypothetical protein